MTDSWVRCLLSEWAPCTRLVVNTNVLSTVRLFELTEEIYAWKSSQSKMVVEVKKRVFSDVKYLDS